MKGRTFTGVLAVFAMLAFAWPASAQLQRGAIYGTVIDNTSAVLPGVTITLSSNVSAPQTVVSGSRGEFRFGELDPGTYTISAALQGFAPFKRENVIVNVGSNIQLPIQMALAGVQQQVTVTAATPVLNEREHGNTTTFGDAVLNEVPTARDPWVLLQQVPGVLVDRINVGGSESGQQSSFSARGDNGSNTMWNMDGVTITDMAAIGSSPTYYNFDVFQEVQFSTGLVDPRQQTGALGINMVTKRGTNDFHGLARYYFDNHSLQTTNLPSGIQPCPPGMTSGVGCYAGNHINQIADYGGDVGGPVVRNKLWFWGSAAKNDIRQFAITGQPDNTQLKSYAAKIDFQPVSANHANFMWYRGEKLKFGRNAGETRPPETTWNQSGPTNIYKFEDSHTFGAHLLVTGRYAHVSEPFQFLPQGGMSAPVWQDVDNGIWHGSFYSYVTDRPQDQVNGDANYFRGAHEVKFGFQWRRTPVSSATTWSGPGVISFVGDSLGLPPGFGLAQLTRPSNVKMTERDVSFYVGDTISFSRVTFDAALRYDRQDGSNTAAAIPANPLFPDIMPSIDFPGGSRVVKWDNWSPRIGATVRVNDKTNVRASYALYEAQLPAAYIQSVNPVQLAGITYVFADDGSHVAKASNIDTSTIFSNYGIDPANPTQLTSSNLIDPNLKAPRTHSVIVALDREVMPNFAVSTSVGFGRTNDLIWQIYPGLTQADFVAVGPPPALKGVAPATTYYMLAPGVTPPTGGLLENRPGYHQRYWNWDVTATKRLANRWMFRGYLTLQNNQEFYDNPAIAIQDPTPLTSVEPNTGFAPWIVTGKQGGIVVNSAGNGSGSHGDVFIMSKWQYSLMGLYQFPFGITASGTVYGRQGYPSPIYSTVNRRALGTSSQVLVSNDLNAVRNPNVHITDLRAEKSFTYRGVGAIFSVDAFNVLNSNTVLQRNRQLQSVTFDQAREIVAPRVFRLGVRIQF